MMQTLTLMLTVNRQASCGDLSEFVHHKRSSPQSNFRRVTSTTWTQLVLLNLIAFTSGRQLTLVWILRGSVVHRVRLI